MSGPRCDEWINPKSGYKHQWGKNRGWYDETPDYNPEEEVYPGCMACLEPERYDDHIHEGAE